MIIHDVRSTVDRRQALLIASLQALRLEQIHMYYVWSEQG